MPQQVASKLKVRLIKTPEFNSEKYLDVCYFLQSFPGSIDFIEDMNLVTYKTGGEREYRQHEEDEEKINIKLYDYIDNFKGISGHAQSFFSLCDFYKSESHFKSNSIVVLLTNHKVSQDLPSIYDAHNNIVIAVAEWDKYPEIDDLNPITHLIIKTILESIANSDKTKTNTIELDTSHEIVRNRKRITSHELPVGCINDLSENHFRVLLKLNNTKFCDSCIKTMIGNGVEIKVIQQGIKILEAIADQSQGKNRMPIFSENYKLNSDIVLFNNEMIYFKDFNVEIYLPPIQKALYVFFLINVYESGITLSGVPEFRLQLRLLYKLFVKNDITDSEMAKQIQNLAENRKRLFESTRSAIRRRLIRQLGNLRADEYSINGSPLTGLMIDIPKRKILVRLKNVYEISTCKGVDYIGTSQLIRRKRWESD